MPRISSVVIFASVFGGCAPKDTVPPAVDSAAPGAVAATQPLPTSPVGSWRWVSVVTPVETIQAPTTGQYTLIIDDSTANGVADCNRLMSKATWTETQLSFGPIATTKMGCPPGGMGDRYLKFLGGAAVWFFRTDTLFVDLMADSGTMRFVRTE